ncbi:YcnI family protein [Spongiactinospora sp. TRM90649]|uniref:YcnI family copper-binding membrane protein n=1 Tax=Spongiactinospora sp. TRM90649 TaxID=3031114 RepID=UPI0023F6C59F|nr:YcnI family protein [Spongiactinospora sp. TRM90649]MDF5753910.1 YcnI family protein [Spongiactinospora sp. TRM90649]
MSHLLRSAATVAAATTALAIGLAVPALAHVTVNPGTAEQGGFTKVAFRVPNERDDAATTQVEVNLPKDHPLAFVSVRPVGGWQVKVTESKLEKPVTTEHGEIKEAVTKITWSGGKIESGQFQEFEVSMGFIPSDTDRLVFPAVQTYSTGEVVKWDDEPTADGTEPERPAPVLKLVPAAGGGHGDATPSAAASPSAAAAPQVSAQVSAVAAGSPQAGSDTTARVLAGVGIAAGAIGTVIGLFGLRRPRS